MAKSCEASIGKEIFLLQKFSVLLEHPKDQVGLQPIAHVATKLCLYTCAQLESWSVAS